MYPHLIDWFRKEYENTIKRKLDMGKGCIRFKNMDTIPYDLLAELIKKITVDDYIKKYEESRK